MSYGDERDGQGAAEEPGQVSPFDAILHEDANGNEYWSARELGAALGYTEWRNFKRAISQARIACEASGHAVSDHFVDVNKMVAIGSGTRRRIEDVRLSRYACYLVVQNADPDKPIVALGQTYFAVQTRRQELADIERLTEAQKRLALREQIASRNTELATTARARALSPRRTSPSSRTTATWASTMASGREISMPEKA